MFNKSSILIFIGLFLMVLASIIFYFDVRSVFAYAFFATGFLLVGIGILLGFASMVSDDKE